MRRVLTLAAFMLVLSATTRAETDAELPLVVVYAPSPCLSCIDWADHLRKGGFEVSMKETLIANMPRMKRWLNVPSELESVHTATVAGYFLEGFVPIEDVLQLLKEKPKARGLAVPGLVRGTPGREISNPVCETACIILDNGGREKDIRREAYNTLLVESDGSTSIFARH
ncbi:MAG: metal-binding protein [Sulfuritalea sp.]|nr:metal-binding protein [Sulfuritalea sp.]